MSVVPVNVRNWKFNEWLNFAADLGREEAKLGKHFPAFDESMQIIRDPKWRVRLAEIFSSHKSFDPKKSTVGDFLKLLQQDAQKETKAAENKNLGGGEVLRIKKIPAERDSQGNRNDQDEDDVSVTLIDSENVEDKEDFTYYKATLADVNKKGDYYLVPEAIWSKSPSLKEANPYSISNLLKTALALMAQTGTGAAQILANAAPSSLFSAGPSGQSGSQGSQVSQLPQLGSVPSSPAVFEKALFALQQPALQKVFEGLSQPENGSQVVSSVVPSSFPDYYEYSTNASDYSSDLQPVPEVIASPVEADVLQSTASVAEGPEVSLQPLVPEVSDALVKPAEVSAEDATALVPQKELNAFKIVNVPKRKAAAATAVAAVDADGGPSQNAEQNAVSASAETPTEDVELEKEKVQTHELEGIAAASAAQKESLFLNGSSVQAIKALNEEQRVQVMARVLEYARSSKCVVASLKGVRAKLVGILSGLLETTKHAGQLQLAAADVDGMTSIIAEIKRGAGVEDSEIDKRDTWISKLATQQSTDATPEHIHDALENTYKDMGAMLLLRTTYQGQLKRARISSVATAIGKASARMKFSSAALASLQEANVTHQRCAVQYESAISELANSAWDIIKGCEKGGAAEKAWVRVEMIFRGEDAYALLASQSSDTGFPAWPDQVAAYEVPRGHLGASTLEMCDVKEKSCTTENLAPTEVPEVKTGETSEYWKRQILKMVSRRGKLPPATLNISAAVDKLKPYTAGANTYASLKQLISGTASPETSDIRSIIFQVLFTLAAVHSEVGASLHLFRGADDLDRVKLFEGPPVAQRQVTALRNPVNAGATLDDEISNYAKKIVQVTPSVRIYAVVPDAEKSAIGDSRLDWSIASTSPWVQLDIDYARITAGKPSDVSLDARNFLNLLVQNIGRKSSDAAKVPTQLLQDLKPRSTIWNALLSQPMAALRSRTRNEVPDFVIRGEIGS